MPHPPAHQPPPSRQAGRLPAPGALSPGDDEDRIAEGVRSYASLERRHFVTFLAMLACVLAMGIAIGKMTPLDSIARQMLIGLLGLGVCGFGLVSSFAYARLLLFRCPRCGKLVNLTLWSRGPTFSCRGCELGLRTDPRTP